MSFGKIEEIDINRIKAEIFRTKYWDIKKDEIKICKDCEFRYICHDCRVFVEDSNDLYSKPSKCGYNPYIAKWSHEDGYHTLAECGVISNKQGFSIDHEKIAKINEELWGEDE